jgi:membrane-bound lytic murein transglycosylase D
MIAVHCLAALMLATTNGPTEPVSVPTPSVVAHMAAKPAGGRPAWDIPIEFNKAVDRWLVFYQTKGRRSFQIHLRRAGRYESTMRAIMREHGLPQDLVYLSMIESGYDPNAYSHAHAVGLWQFLASTGRRYGLRIDEWVDERRDPVLATRAAAAYLKDLYEEFGSWYLAAAAYNGGSRRVWRAVRRTGSRDFWTLRRRGYFADETKEYVPKFIAAALIAKQPDRYGFDLGTAPILGYDLGRVPDATSLDVIAEAAGVDVAEVIALNPQLIRRMTPPGASYHVRLPQRTGHRFATNYAQIPAGERLRAVRHTVKRGDTFARLAKTYGSELSAIRSANPNVHPRRLEVGQRLFIPISTKSTRLASSTP